MCGVEIPKIRYVGMVTISVFSVYLVAILIYNGVGSGFLTPKGSNASFNIFSSLEFFVLFMNIVMSLIGFFGFYLTNKGLMIYFTVVQCICFFITLGITISLLGIGSMGTSARSISDYLSCYDNMITPSGPGSTWNITNYYRYPIDYYLEQADQLLCSSDCPCGMSSPFTSPNKAFWIVKNPGASNFPQCPRNVQNRAEQEAANKGYFGYIPDAISTMNWLEDKFNCAGFCISNYTSKSGRNVTMDKYVFTDVNRGKIENQSCFYELVKWIINFCLAIGIIDVFIVIFDFVLVILGYMFWCNFKDPEPVPNTFGIVNPGGQAVMGQPVYQPNFGGNNNNHGMNQGNNYQGIQGPYVNNNEFNTPNNYGNNNQNLELKSQPIQIQQNYQEKEPKIVD